MRLVGALTLVSAGAAPVYAQSVSKCGLTISTGQTSSLGSICAAAAARHSPLGPGYDVCSGVNVETAYEDNAFRTETGAKGDGYLQVKPAISIDRVAEHNELRANAQATLRRQFERPANNFIDFSAGSSGAYETAGGTRLAARVRAKRGHESRETLDSSGQKAELARFIEPQAAFGITRPFAMGFASFGQTVTYRKFTSDPGDVARGRDQIVYDSLGCIGTEISPLFGIMLVGNFQYTDRRGNRSTVSQERNFEVGISARLVYEVSGLTDLALEGGWLTTRSGSDDSAKRNTFQFAGGLAWHATDLTTFNAAFDTRVRQTSLPGVGVSIVRGQELRIIHDLTPEFDISARGALNFENVLGSKTESVGWDIGAEIAYVLTESVQLQGRLQRSRRESDPDDLSFTNNRITLTLTAAY